MAYSFRIKVSDSFWFIPVLMGIVGILLSQFIIWIDLWIISEGVSIPLGGLGADGGRGILTAISGSVLGVAATSFTITTSVLATASSTYGPRLVRNFMADRRNQFVLGSFVLSFLYALMVLRAVRDSGDIGSIFVPSIAINIAILFAILNVIVLIYFIHHIAESIQISTLISRVRDDMVKSIESLYPLNKELKDKPNQTTEEPDAELPSEDPQLLRATQDGFIQWIDYESLTNQAVNNNARIKMLVQPGDYVFLGMVVAHIWQPAQIDSAGVPWPLHTITISQTRTPYQDIRYAIQQPIDITIRALSSGINDPYTAINALGGLSSGLTRLCQRDNARAVVAVDGTPVLYKRTITIEHMLESTFRTLRSNVISSVDATMAVLDLAQKILETTQRDSYRNIVIKAVHLIDDAFIDSNAPQADKTIIKNATEQIIRDHAIEAEDISHSPIDAKKIADQSS